MRISRLRVPRNDLDQRELVEPQRHAQLAVLPENLCSGMVGLRMRLCEFVLPVMSVLRLMRMLGDGDRRRVQRGD